MAADHHQLSLLRMLEQPPSGLVAHQRSVHADIRILLLPAGEAFSEDLSLSLLALSPIHPQNRKHPQIGPGVQRHQVHPSAGGFVEG
ncbi:Uncharacterised protein [Mycobacterium tuberculosis]|nr:Uncharacterised protein [Mycobacterium tuberculosis]